MSCARATTRDIRRWFALSSVTVALACVRVAELPPPNASNPLPKGVEQKEVDFLKQIEPYKASKNPHDRERTAKGTCFIWCPNTKVRIVALGDTYDIDPTNPPNTGRPVAHLVNLEKKTEKYYGLLPQDQAGYYLWVDSKSSTQAQWTLLELSHVTHTVTAALPRGLNYCHKYPLGTKVSDADFAEYKHRSCDVPIADTTAKVSQASIVPTTFIALFERAFAFLTEFASTGGGWISCSNGCCT